MRVAVRFPHRIGLPLSTYSVRGLAVCACVWAGGWMVRFGLCQGTFKLQPGYGRGVKAHHRRTFQSLDCTP